MKIEDLEIKDSYLFDYERLALFEKEIFQQFPKDYQDFLKKYNGGFVNDNDLMVCFNTTLVSNYNGKIHTDCGSFLEEFWGFISYENQKPIEGRPTSILHEHFDRHLDELFLPQGIVVIGRSSGNSLIAISVNVDDFGNIYYWEWYWQYPWFKDFFNERSEKAKALLVNINEKLDDEHLPFIYEPPQSLFYLIETKEQRSYMEVSDALNYTSIVKIADSFTEFLDNLYFSDIS